MSEINDLNYIIKILKVDIEDAQKILDTYKGNNTFYRKVTLKEYLNNDIIILNLDELIELDPDNYFNLSLSEYFDCLQETFNTFIFASKKYNVFISCDMW